MGIFSKEDNSEKNNSARLSAIRKKIKPLYENIEEKEFVYYVDNLDKNDRCKIKPLSLVLSCIEAMFNNTVDYNIFNYNVSMKYAENVYEKMFQYDEETPGADELNLIFLEFFAPGGVIAKRAFSHKLFSCFKDSFNYVTFMSRVLELGISNGKLLVDYGVAVREYYIDDLEFTYNMINVAEMIGAAPEPERPDILEAEKSKVKRMNGIYNIDAVDIAKAETQLRDAKRIVSEGSQVVEEAETLSRQLRILVEETQESVKSLCDKELLEVQIRVKAFSDEINNTCNEFLQQQKDRMVFDRQEYVKSVFADAEAELNKLRAMAANISGTTAKELSNVNHQAEEAVRRIDKLVNNDAEVKRILKQSMENQAFLDKINKLQIINDSNIEAMNKLMQEQKEQAEKPAVVQMTPVAEGASQVVVQRENSFDSDEEIALVNPLLDQKVPFRERWAKVMERKAKKVKSGVHFHKMFDDVLMAVMEDANPYLTGPSGCGKTFMIKQIAELLEVEFIDIGYINEEYDILGFQTANGGYSKPNFYRCYKYGKIAFCDELDNGNSRATVKLNSFLVNSVDASYNFPNGENVRRHSNFRIVGAGNTAGNGADTNYNTREKIEESVQQRFMPIYVGYDNEVEKNLLVNYKDWFEFVKIFRMATDAWANDMMSDAPGILTTRDADRIRKYLDNGSFSDEQIIRYEFVQTKDLDYLLFLDDFMKREVVKYKSRKEKYTPTKQMEIFSRQVNAIRENGGKR